MCGGVWGGGGGGRDGISKHTHQCPARRDQVMLVLILWVFLVELSHPGLMFGLGHEAGERLIVSIIRQGTHCSMRLRSPQTLAESSVHVLKSGKDALEVSQAFGYAAQEYTIIGKSHHTTNSQDITP